MRDVEAVERGIGVVGYRHRWDRLDHQLYGWFAFFGGICGRAYLWYRGNTPANSRTLILRFHDRKYVRSQRLLRILDLDRDIKQRREALTHEEPAQLSTRENGYWNDFLRHGCRGSRARGLGLGNFLRADIGYQRRLRCRGCFIAVTRDGDRQTFR